MNRLFVLNHDSAGIYTLNSLIGKKLKCIINIILVDYDFVLSLDFDPQA